MAKKESLSFYDILRARALGGGGSGTTKRTVYGTSEGEIYQLSDGKLYRVRRAKNGD